MYWLQKLTSISNIKVVHSNKGCQQSLHLTLIFVVNITLPDLKSYELFSLQKQQFLYLVKTDLKIYSIIKSNSQFLYEMYSQSAETVDNNTPHYDTGSRTCLCILHCSIAPQYIVNIWVKHKKIILKQQRVIWIENMLRIYIL